MIEKTSLTDLERRAIAAAISAVSSESLQERLKRQAKALVVISRRDNRPYGFYTYFTCPSNAECLLSDDELNKSPPAAWGVYGEGEPPISFLIYVKDGKIDFMEASTSISEWPEREDLIEFPAELQQS